MGLSSQVRDVLAYWLENALPPALGMTLGYLLLNSFTHIFYPIMLKQDSLTFRPLLLFKREMPLSEVAEVKLVRFSEVFWPAREYRPMMIWPNTMLHFHAIILVLRQHRGKHKTLGLIVLRPAKLANAIEARLQGNQGGA